jgi:hypothetical protein
MVYSALTALELGHLPAGRVARPAKRAEKRGKVLTIAQGTWEDLTPCVRGRLACGPPNPWVRPSDGARARLTMELVMRGSAELSSGLFRANLDLFSPIGDHSLKKNRDSTPIGRVQPSPPTREIVIRPVSRQDCRDSGATRGANEPQRIYCPRRGAGAVRSLTPRVQGDRQQLFPHPRHPARHAAAKAAERRVERGVARIQTGGRCMTTAGVLARPRRISPASSPYLDLSSLKLSGKAAVLPANSCNSRQARP